MVMGFLTVTEFNVEQRNQLCLEYGYSASHALNQVDQVNPLPFIMPSVLLRKPILHYTNIFRYYSIFITSGKQIACYSLCCYKLCSGFV